MNKLNFEDMNTHVWQIMFSVKLKLVAESLNNEGNIGNISKTRIIKDSDGLERSAISAAMFSHINDTYLRKRSNKDELCSTCRIFSPMKNGKIVECDKKLSDSGNRIKNCIIDDMSGFMNVGGGNEKRRKVVSYSWAISTQSEIQQMTHNRIDLDTGKTKAHKINNESTLADELNTNAKQNTQMIFYRNIRSADYALGCMVDLSRVAFDDEKFIYVFEDKNIIKQRVKKVIMSVRDTLIDVDGALTSTNMPHLLGIEGCMVHKTSPDIVTSKSSALNDNYRELIEQLSGKDNVYKFDNVVEFNDAINLLLDDEYLDKMIERNMNHVDKFNKK